jgi:hypothetical protein
MKQLHPIQIEAAEKLLSTTHAILDSIPGMGSMAVMAYCIGQLPRTDTVLIVAPRVLHMQWGRELETFGNIADPARCEITTPQLLLDPRRRARLKGFSCVVVNHAHLGPKSAEAVIEVANSAKRVWLRLMNSNWPIIEKLTGDFVTVPLK